jgi:hypothetical protein
VDADGRLVLVSLAFGIGVDLALRDGPPTVGGLLGTLVAVAALAASRRIAAAVARWCLVVPLAFAPFLVLRTSDWLLLIDAVAIVGGLAAAALFARSSDWRHLQRALGPFVRGGALLVRPLARPLAGRHDGAVAAGRGVLIAAPVVVGLGALLASADAVFAGFLSVNVSPTMLWVDAFLVVVGTLCAAGLLQVASLEPVASANTRRPRLGATEWTIVLGSVVVLFGAFAVAQLVAASDGGHHVLETNGLTYAEYARSGYFQLLAVAGLTAALLTTLWTVADREVSGVRFTVLAEACIALTLLIVAVSLRRLDLYEDAYGWTMLRLIVKASAVWLAIAFVLLGVRLGGVAPRRSWLLPTLAGTALAIGLGLNVADPEAAVVRHDVGRADADAAYLTSLSDDAVPTLVDALPSLPPDVRAQVLAGLCPRPAERAGLSWNRSAARAERARDRVCPSRDRPPDPFGVDR